MTAHTILTRFRAITDLTTSDFADADVTDKAEPEALLRFNNIMELATDATITTHTTGNKIYDEIITWLVGSYAYEEVNPDKEWQGSELTAPEAFDQKAFKKMYELDATKIQYDAVRGVYFVRAPSVAYTPHTKTARMNNVTSATEVSGD